MSGPFLLTLGAMMYTLEDLEKAQAELDAHLKRWENYGGNNPNKYQANIRNAQSRVRSITESLKAQELIPRTEQELLEARLDNACPKAGSKQIVEFEGKKYQKQFFPLSRSRSGKSVSEWGAHWVSVD
jgi:exonuclease VII small subunit